VALTEHEVAGLAPDPATLSRAMKLADVGAWSALASGDGAACGQCQGSRLYDVTVSLDDGVGSCSCPSRKAPCKHVIALALLSVRGEVPSGPLAEFATAWVARRQERARRARSKLATVDVEAAQKRRAKRDHNVTEGLRALDRWLCDWVRRGAAGLEAEPFSSFDTIAARMVDAQAPGLAQRIRMLGEGVSSGPDWPERTVVALGELALIVHAWRRRDALPPLLVEDVRAQLGFKRRREQVLAAGHVVSDRWSVVGQWSEEIDDLLEGQRTWLWGQTTARYALVLQFSYAGASYAERLSVGTAVEAELAFWPSAAPQRAILSIRRGPVPYVSPGTAVDIAGMHAALAERLGAVPFTATVPVTLAGVVPVPGDPWWLRDPAGAGVVVEGGGHWRLLAVSGGLPIDVLGEWNGRRFRPLAVISELPVSVAT
jgi:hypothetical protein